MELPPDYLVVANIPYTLPQPRATFAERPKRDRMFLTVQKKSTDGVRHATDMSLLALNGPGFMGHRVSWHISR